MIKKTIKEIFTRDRGFIYKILSSIPDIKVRIYTTEKKKKYHPLLEIKTVSKDRLKSIFIDNNIKFSGKEDFVYSVFFENYYQVLGAIQTDELDDFWEKDGLYLILDRVQDIRNLGALCRIAYWAGIKNIFISQKGSGAINTGVLESSSGYLLKLNLIKVNLLDLLDIMDKKGIKTIATVINGGKSIIDYFDKVGKGDDFLPAALIVGNERYGVKQPLIEKASEKMTIPLWDRVESLNLSVATGIILYEIAKNREKQRKTKHKKV